MSAGFRAGKRGFHITFANDVTVSVQFGRGNYCVNYDLEPEREHGNLESYDAEVMAWDKRNNPVTPDLAECEGNTVIGYQTPEQVLAILNKAAAYVSEETK